MREYVKIYCCGDCVYYNWKKRKCNRGAEDEGTGKENFYRDCPLGIHKEEDAPTVDAMQWIPCSERMPEGGRQVLVYARSVHFALAKYDEMREADGTYKKQWVTFDAWKPFYKIKEVIAWMPIPKPWKGEKDG